jgi:hypothetical protein
MRGTPEQGLREEQGRGGEGSVPPPPPTACPLPHHCPCYRFGAEENHCGERRRGGHCGAKRSGATQGGEEVWGCYPLAGAGNERGAGKEMCPLSLPPPPSVRLLSPRRGDLTFLSAVGYTMG